MGYELYRHVLNHAPEEIDATARLVLAVIADDANEKTRTSYMGIDLLAHRSGLSSHGVGKALRRLANAGIEIRIPIGVDGRGRPVFAVKGHRTTYRIPVFPEREFAGTKVAPQGDLKSEERSPEKATNDAAKVAPQAPKVARWGAKVAPQGDPPPQSPQSPHSFSHEDGSLFPVPEEASAPKDEMTKPAKKKTAAPEHLDITDQMRAWANQNTPGLNLELETLKFLNHHGAKGSKFIDWVKAWRNWMINARQYAEERQQGRRSNLRVVGGSRADVPDNSYWDTVSDEDLKRNLL